MRQDAVAERRVIVRILYCLTKQRVDSMSNRSATRVANVPEEGFSMWRLWLNAIASTPPLLDHQAVEQRFGISKTRQLELASNGEIVIVKLGARSMVTAASLFAMLDRLPVAQMTCPSLVAMRKRSNARKAARAAKEAGSAARPATT